MTNLELFAFSYFIVAILSGCLLCNALATRKTGFERKRVTPGFAFFLGLIWPIGLLAAYVAFIRDK